MSRMGSRLARIALGIVACGIVASAIAACGSKTPPPEAPVVDPPASSDSSATPESSGSSSTTSSDAPRFEMQRDQLVLPGPVMFETASDVLKPDSDEVLAHVKAFLDARADVTTLRIESHADGDTRDAQALTERRAMSVSRWLIAHGVDCKRLVAVGFGSTKPIEAEDSPAGKAANRRVEAHVAALRGHAVGGMPLDGGGALAGDPCE